jgi:hypothetical protein
MVWFAVKSIQDTDNGDPTGPHSSLWSNLRRTHLIVVQKSRAQFFVWGVEGGIELNRDFQPLQVAV